VNLLGYDTICEVLGTCGYSHMFVFVLYTNIFGYNTTQPFTTLCPCQFLVYNYTKLFVTQSPSVKLPFAFIFTVIFKKSVSTCLFVTNIYFAIWQINIYFAIWQTNIYFAIWQKAGRYLRSLPQG